MARVINNQLTQREIQELLDYMDLRDQRSDVRPDVISKHPRWNQDQWPQHILASVLDRLLDYNYIVEECVFNDSRISFRLHADSGDGDLTRLGHAVLIPLFVEGQGATVFFDNHWRWASTKFSRIEILPFEYDIPVSNNNTYYVKDLRQLLTEIRDGQVPTELGTMPDIENMIQDLILARQGHKLSKPDARTSDYHKITNYNADLDFSPELWQHYLSHVPLQNFQGLTVEQVIEWHPGDVILFERTQLHAAATGHHRKIGVTVFTQRH